VEEAALLMPVQRVVGGVQIEDDLCRRRGMRRDEQIHPVLDQIRRMVIGEADGKPFDQPDRPVGGAQQQRPGARCACPVRNAGQQPVGRGSCRAGP
jgi:hypothetical protein